MRIDRLKELVDYMKSEKKGHQKFIFYDFVKPLSPEKGICGTAGCMAGELPFLDRVNWRFSSSGSPLLRNPKNGGSYTQQHLVEYFETGYEEVAHLFLPHNQHIEKFGGKILRNDATLEEVIANAEEFINNHK